MRSKLAFTSLSKYKVDCLDASPIYDGHGGLRVYPVGEQRGEARRSDAIEELRSLQAL